MASYGQRLYKHSVTLQKIIMFTRILSQSKSEIPHFWYASWERWIQPTSAQLFSHIRLCLECGLQRISVQKFSTHLQLAA